MSSETPSANGAAVRLAARLPKNEANGLRELAAALVADPQPLRYALIAFDVARIIDDLDEATDTAVVRIQRIEPLAGEFADKAQALIAEAAHARLGDAALNFKPEGAGP